MADLVSSQVLQKTLDELRNITRIDLCVTNTDGVLLVTTFPETAIDAESIRSFVLSAADSQIVQEYHYFKVYDNQNVEYILISKGSSDDAYMIGKIAVCEIQNLIVAYKERLDKNNFIQNLLLDNLLLVDIYNRAKKLRIDTEARRVVFIVETKYEKDNSAMETIKSLYASKPKDYITAIDEKNIIIVKEIKEALNGRNIKVSAICAGFQGFILSTDPAIRKQCMDTMKEIIAPAGELGSTGVIIVPAFNGQKPAMPHTQETRDFLCEQFNEMGNFAKEHGTTVIFEPLNRKEAFYLRQVADAASICRDINNPGVRCMGDFWHMTWEETSDMGAFLSAGEYLQHVHVASRKRRSMPGEDGEADNYVNGFKGLKMLDYDKYVSFECGCQGDRNVLVPAAVELLRKQWEEA